MKSLLQKISYLLVVSIFMLAAGSLVGAQDKDWRPISPGDLAAKTPVVEPDADAEAIFWEVRIDDSSDDNLSRRHYVRVKIFTERGREKYSKFDIPFTKGTKIKDLAARLIKADGTIVEIGKNDIFEREIIKADKVKVKAKSFAVPNIEPGVIIEYRYKETIEDAGAMGMRLQFQRDIPVQTLSYYYKPYNEREPSYQSYNFSGTKFIKDKNGFYLAERRNVPALKEEPRMPPEDTVRPWMLLTGSRVSVASASAFSITFTVKNPGNQVAYWGAVSVDWAPLTKLMTKPGDEVKKLAEQVAAGATEPEDKLRKLYEYCQTQIQNTTFDPSITEEQRAKLPEIKSVKDVIKRKAGSAMYIDLLFGSMAAALGFDSRVALIADRSKMFFDPKMTNEAFVHPGGIGVKAGADWLVLNPGSRFAPYGMLPWYEEATWAMFVGEKDYYWRETPLTSYPVTKAKRTGKFTLLEDGTLEGTVTMEYSGHFALGYRLENYDESPAAREEAFKNEIKADMSSAELTDVAIENIEDPSKPLIKRFKVRVPSYAQKTGKRLFLQPGFFEYGKAATFSGSDRKFDIFFRYPWSEEDKIEIAFPKNFDLDNAEQPVEVSDPSRIGSNQIKIGIDKANSVLVYDRKFHFGGGGNVLFKSQVYQPLKNLFDAFHKVDSHTITLRQK
jgi:Domain of Unknown Function with PDB structure (DUF3857)/Transglutaminase-like superfamily